LRRIAVQWVLFSVLALILFCIVPSYDAGQADDWQAQGEVRQTAALPHGMAQSDAHRTDSGGLALRANLIPSANYQFFNPWQVLPSWGRICIAKVAPREQGFFLSILVLLFFSLFYQRARAVSGSDSDGAGTLTV
jgi:hypothetical protein